jgi:anaerobic magnesium-protoporphyrin IX monomethyl ester cyclase
MNITFLSPYLSMESMGIRIMSALLRDQGHQTKTFSLPDRGDQMRRQHMVDVFIYDPTVLEQVVENCRGSDLVGITLMTQYFDAAVQLTKTIKEKLGTPVIWGGIHPTTRPEECLNYADMVCVGEGEISVPELVRRMAAGEAYQNVPGIWVKNAKGEVVNNGAAPLVENLDSLPFPLYDLDTDMMLWQGNLIPFTRETFHKHLHLYFPAVSNCKEVAYQLITTRGCPFSCSFCGEAPMDELYTKPRYLRRRSLDNILSEIKWAHERLGPFGEICFCDDTFPARPMAEIEEFARRYKKEIGLPFYCLVSPSNVTEKRMQILVDAGLAVIGMGIQSGSDHVLAEFTRSSFGSIKHVKEAVRILDLFNDRLTPYYDFMHEYSYETDEDLLQTLDLITSLPPKARIRCYSLVPYPGTDIYQRSKRDGLIIDDHKEIYSRVFGARRKPNYLNFLIDIAQKPIPRKLLRLLIQPKAYALLGKPVVGKLMLDIYIGLKKLKRVFMPNITGL